MDEKYRLVFRGEILEGQHRSVVKRRLSEALKLSEKQMDQLFSGKSVVIKVDVDEQTATRYQTLFKQAGGRLRVQTQAATQKHSASSVQEAPAADRKPAADKAPAADEAPAAKKQPAADKAPAAKKQPAADENPAFTVLNNYAPPPDQPTAEIEAPNFQVADIGSDLLDAIETPEVVIPEPDFELAEVGADILTETSEPVVVEIVTTDFGVADVGADIGVSSDRNVPEAPDVSHIRLAEQV